MDGHQNPRPGPIRRALLVAAGWISIGLAAAGVVLPLLPTTPFLLLAAACFVRSSPRLHRRLLEDRRFGPLLRQWERNHTIPTGVKPKAFLVVIVTFGVSIAMVEPIPLRVMLVVIACCLFVFLARLRTEGEYDEASISDD